MAAGKKQGSGKGSVFDEAMAEIKEEQRRRAIGELKELLAKKVEIEEVLNELDYHIDQIVAKTDG